MYKYGNLKTVAVIPAFNEAKTIRQAVNEVKEKTDEVVVVNDASTDQTGDLAKSAGAKVLTHLVNRDQGAALQTGTDYALLQGADIIIHFDADGQHRAEDIQRLIEPLLKGEADVVLGSRFMGEVSNIPPLRKIVLFLGKLFNLLFLGVTLTDPQSGLRVLTRAAAKRIEITEDGKAHCSEILGQLKKNNLRVKEVPIVVNYTSYSKQKGQSNFNAVRIGLRLILKKFLK
ncbi:MAG: glycosyltransferase family 2 protein [bacterium]